MWDNRRLPRVQLKRLFARAQGAFNPAARYLFAKITLEQPRCPHTVPRPQPPAATWPARALCGAPPA
ncbi:hypothetical protein PSAC2689_120040 [Paraburkholderia sacchari]